MDLFSVSTIKSLLARYNAAPLKRLGQNFLISQKVLQKIIEAATLDRGEAVLEIGPGLGTLTQELAKKVKKVIAIEKDKKMVEILKETLKDYKNVKIINADVLKLRNQEIGKLENYKITANLPYNIASAVIRKFLEIKNPPKEMILMLQKEVTQRICAKPPRMSLLAVAIQFYAEAKIINYVKKGAFWPPPKVDSAIIKITPYSDPNIRKHLNDRNIFFKVARAGFSAPRKQLINNLSKKLKIERQIILSAVRKAKIKPEQRAETLNINDWLILTKILEPYL